MAWRQFLLNVAIAASLLANSPFMPVPDITPTPSPESESQPEPVPDPGNPFGNWGTDSDEVIASIIGIVDPNEPADSIISIDPPADTDPPDYQTYANDVRVVQDRWCLQYDNLVPTTRCVVLPGPGEPGDPAAAVSLEDVERYKPAGPGVVSQPEGWGIVDRPVNFVLNAEPHVVAGELLGQPADVRFTPVAFRVNFSDGGAIDSNDAGATWEDLRQDDFTETATSYVFTERGDHQFTPTVLYTAEYRFAGSGWTAIPGGLAIGGDSHPIYIGIIETVLVPNSGERR
ncbi:hypothetical protein [Agromyces archimandritae]|uniref:PKD domain-containing protein n=1 Tax=Agromyces archimandritae TaxID=2781962 RepID=A0A975FPI4_9MICO|nr:hypothetical protein [Agromyces archimandritae]QTX05639.1 hypothetical protein G127AT_05385 [Agromyces archimandritae]